MAKILIVDDEEDTSELINLILKKEGHKTFLAGDGKECLDLLKKENPDLVLLDIMMPRMSGWEAFKRIKKMGKHLKVVFLSAIDISKERRKTLMDEGLADYINKPFTSSELVKRINVLLG